MPNNQQLHFESFSASLATGEIEFGFTFKESDETDDTLFDLVLFRGILTPASAHAGTVILDGYETLAAAIAGNHETADEKIIILGPETDTDNPEIRERLYWSETKGWVNHSEADMLGVQAARQLIQSMAGANALEVKAAQQPADQ